ncbi:MAG: NAD(P)/FAD-dependent oxidoreductase [Lachnospiraceae bacterium]|nr:NAD(P)/FAD-dependent oxidoreductase [Lachnospiraceae bacterium]
MRNNSVVIVGAGAAGCMAAVTAAKRGLNVTLIDRNSKIGRKMLITGKGRCNVTNNCNTETLIASVPTNNRFLYSAFSAFSSQDTMSFFEENGVPLKTERGNRVFPQSDKSMDIIDAFFMLIRRYGVKLVNDDVKSLIINDGVVVGVKSMRKEYFADKVLIACGGCSYPQTGSTGYGYELAKSAGHTIIEPKPSLVPIETVEEWPSQLQGLSLKNVLLTVKNDRGKTVYSELGEMLFTHFGISGPIVLSASANMNSKKSNGYGIIIDLKPALSEEQLDKRLQRDFDKFSNKDIINSLDELLPKRLIPVVISVSEIDEHEKCRDLTRIERHKLLKVLKGLTLTFKSFRPIAEAIVTSGGISVREINPKTMESKLVKNLYFAGEIIDVDAYTGGFNLQIAFSTGYLAAVSF